MKNSSLSRWLYQNRCFLTKGDTSISTHLCLDGGKLNIPDHLMIEFFEQYAAGLSEGEKYYICETVTPIVKMFCDFDFFCEDEIKLDEVIKYAKILHKTVEFYFKDTYKTVICTSAPKNVQKNKQKKVKTGVHIVWPELFVTTEQAYSLSKVFIDELKKCTTEIDWDDVVDDQVYRNGLRMVGSGKVTNKKRKLKEDGNEYEIIKVDEGRIYSPVMIIEDEEYPLENIFSVDNKKITEYLLATSIRSFNNEKPLVPVEEIPEKIMKKARKLTTKMDTDVNKDIFDRIESFIRYQTITQWNSPMRQLKKHGKFYIAKIDSMYCLNVQREHNSCGIYFQITEGGMIQRCFCRKETMEGRQNGLCSSFKSTIFPLPNEVRKMLFPDSKKKRSVKQQSNKGMKVEMFGSNLLLKKQETLMDYLKMSLNTIKDIEKKCR